MKLKLSKKNIHVIGLVAVVLFIVYLNYYSVTREGLSDAQNVIVNRHNIEIEDMKGKVCLKEDYDKKVEQVNDLRKKLNQMKQLNNTTSTQRNANANVTG